MVIDNLITDETTPHLILGPRLDADIRRRARALEARYPGAMSSSDKRELSRLRELLRLAKQGGRHY
jgi:hypothetical protein